VTLLAIAPALSAVLIVLIFLAWVALDWTNTESRYKDNRWLPPLNLHTREGRERFRRVLQRPPRGSDDDGPDAV
jgi:hypothetical protein